MCDACFVVQDRGRETSNLEAVDQRERSRSRAPCTVACYFKHEDDDAQPARQKKGKSSKGKKGKRRHRRIRLAWGRSSCHFRT